MNIPAEICRDRGGSRERPKRVDVESEVMSLETGEIAYLLGRNGATKQRLASFSGARLEIDPNGGEPNSARACTCESRCAAISFIAL